MSEPQSPVFPCRYKNALGSNVIKGMFSEYEDVLLMCLVHRFGKRFGLIAEHMPHRGVIQCRTRYTNYLEKLRNLFGGFTEAEDKIIMRHVKKHGATRWRQLGDALKRPTANVRHRYKLIVSWMQKYPGASLADVPRRNSCNYKVSKNSM